MNFASNQADSQWHDGDNHCKIAEHGSIAEDCSYAVRTQEELETLGHCHTIDYFHIECSECNSLIPLSNLQSISGKSKDGVSFFAQELNVKSLQPLARLKGALQGSFVIYNNLQLVSLQGLEGISAVGVDRYRESARKRNCIDV